MNITVKDMLDLNPDRYQILDIRSPEQMASGRIPGAIHADKDHILETPGQKSWWQTATMPAVLRADLLPGCSTI